MGGEFLERKVSIHKQAQSGDGIDRQNYEYGF
jgi:hypothetical protein